MTRLLSLLGFIACTLCVSSGDAAIEERIDLGLGYVHHLEMGLEAPVISRSTFLVDGRTFRTIVNYEGESLDPEMLETILANYLSQGETWVTIHHRPGLVTMRSSDGSLLCEVEHLEGVVSVAVSNLVEALRWSELLEVQRDFDLPVIPD